MTYEPTISNYVGDIVISLENWSIFIKFGSDCFCDSYALNEIECPSRSKKEGIIILSIVSIATETFYFNGSPLNCGGWLVTLTLNEKYVEPY